ncbi:MAG: nitrous oxide reductase family maturation protein NosD [Gammaproteobacteria bacterium]|nr:nitrous oxide reductase family maturation protein NosD [Gammaproteobacteria bacterium]
MKTHFSKQALVFNLCVVFSFVCLQTLQAKERHIASPQEKSTQINTELLQETIEQANAGDTLYLESGVWSGSIIINKTLKIIANKTEINGLGQGRVVTIDAPNVEVSGLTISDSGTNLRKSHACLYTTKNANGSNIHNNTMTLCTFGIWVNKSKQVTVHKNTISGKPNTRPSELGNGIHLFDGTGLIISNNHISKARDGIYISVTENSLIKENESAHLRYGIHYMYSYSNRLEGNISHNNTHGYAIMESHELEIVGNIAYDNKQHGMLVRDAEDCQIIANVLINNGDGLFVYTSADNTFKHNWIENNDIGAKIWGGSVRNKISENVFLNNHQQVLYIANQNLNIGQEYRGNFWSDYLGWDQNGDKLGDRPYEVNSFFAQLIYRFPSTILLLRSPSLELLSFLQQRLAILKTATIIDHKPILEIPEALREIHRPGVNLI